MILFTFCCHHFIEIKGLPPFEEIHIQRKILQRNTKKKRKGEKLKKLKEIITDSIFANFETTLRFSSLNDCF